MSGTIINGGEVHSIIANGKEIMQANLGEKATFDGTATIVQYYKDFQVRVSYKTEIYLTALLSDKRVVCLIVDRGNKKCWLEFFDADGNLIKKTEAVDTMPYESGMSRFPEMYIDEKENILLFTVVSYAISRSYLYDRFGTLLSKSSDLDKIEGFGYGYIFFYYNYDQYLIKYDLDFNEIERVSFPYRYTKSWIEYNPDLNKYCVLCDEKDTQHLIIQKGQNIEKDVILQDLLNTELSGYTASQFLRNNMLYLVCTRDYAESGNTQGFLITIDLLTNNITVVDIKNWDIKSDFNNTSSNSATFDKQKMYVDKFKNVYLVVVSIYYTDSYNSEKMRALYKINKNGVLLDKRIDCDSIPLVTYDGYLAGSKMEKEQSDYQDVCIYRNRIFNSLQK